MQAPKLYSYSQPQPDKKISYVPKGKGISTSGFTIVELLIVVVVVAILATISVVAYTGIQQRADTAARSSEMVAWEKIFLTYRATNGGWPSTMVLNSNYCLGDGFPIGAGGVARCRDYGNTTTGYVESDNTAVMNQLRTVASLPNAPKKPVGTTVGPYLRVQSNGVIDIIHLFPVAAGGCPQRTAVEYSNSVGFWCRITVTP